MWPFKRSATVRWAAVTNGCDFNLAKREIAHCFAIMKDEGEHQGKQYYIREDLAQAWQAFVDKPVATTAAELLEVAPTLVPYFEGCRPGGNFYEYERLQQKNE